MVIYNSFNRHNAGFFSKDFYLIGFLLFICNVSGQDAVKGSVRSSSELPLAFASVYILDSEQKVQKIISTDEAGVFQLDLEQEKRREIFVYASYLNKKSDTLLINTNKEIVLYVRDANSINLSDVIIESNKPSLVRKADRFIYIPNKELKEGATTLDILRNAPLIDYDTNSDVFSIINKSSTRVIINGVNSNLPRDMITSMLRSTPAKNIINIEIITSPGSEYSGDTTGGVININLSRNFDEGFLGNLTLTSQQSIRNTSIINGGLNYRKGKIGLRLLPFINSSFNYNISDAKIVNSENRKEETSSKLDRRYIVIGGGFGLDYDIDSQSLFSINGFISNVDGDSEQSNRTIYSQSMSTFTDSVYTSPVSGKDSNLYNFGNIFYQRRLDPEGKNKLTLNIDYNQFKKRSANSGSFFREIPLSDDQLRNYSTRFPQEFLNFSGNLDFSSQINESTKLNIGAQSSLSNFDNSLSYSNLEENDLQVPLRYKYVENYYAVYASTTKTFNEKFNGSIGVRIEGTDYASENVTYGPKADSTYVNIFPNISLAYTFKEKNVLSLALAKKIKRPSIETLLPGRTYYNPNFYEENNPFLQPVVYYNADFMYALNYKYYISAGFSYRDNQYDQFVVPIIDNNGDIIQKRTYLNFGNSRNSYLQLYMRQSFFSGLWEMNFSASINHQSFNSNAIVVGQTINNINCNFSVNNNLYISKEDNFMAFVVLKYFSPEKDISYERKNSLFKNDIGFKKSFENIYLTLYCSDIFNTYGKSEMEYTTNQLLSVNQLNRKEYFRSISFSLNYQFGNSKLKRIKNKEIANDQLKERVN